MQTIELLRLNALDTSDPREDWCRTNIGEQYKDWVASASWWHVHYKFREPAHALMFRLRWEGV